MNSQANKANKASRLNDLGYGSLVNKYNLPEYSKELEGVIFLAADSEDKADSLANQGSYPDRNHYNCVVEDLRDSIFEIQSAYEFLSLGIDNKKDIKSLGSIVDRFLPRLEDDKHKSIDLSDEADLFYKEIEKCSWIDSDQKEDYLESIKDILSYSRDIYALADYIDSESVGMFDPMFDCEEDMFSEVYV